MDNGFNWWLHGKRFIREFYMLVSIGGGIDAGSFDGYWIEQWIMIESLINSFRILTEYNHDP